MKAKKSYRKGGKVPPKGRATNAQRGPQPVFGSKSLERRKVEPKNLRTLSEKEQVRAAEQSREKKERRRQAMRLPKSMKAGGRMVKYQNGGSERDMKRPGRSVVSFREPSKAMLDRTDGFFLPIPIEPEMGGVLIPRELEVMEKMAIESGDPEAIAEYEFEMNKFMNSPEYKEQQEALDRRFQSAKRQYGEAKADYDTRKADYDKMRDAMRVIMNSRLQ